MKFRLIVIALCAAAFAWGFSELVRHSDGSMRSDSVKLACQDWAGDGCARTFER